MENQQPLKNGFKYRVQRRSKNRPNLSIENGESDVYALLNDLLDKAGTIQYQIAEITHQLKELSQMQKQLGEIHKLHFASEHLQKDRSLKDKYLAEILISSPKKR